MLTFVWTLSKRPWTGTASPRSLTPTNGNKFTSKAFITVLHDAEITMSMDGKGRCIDDVFIERLWRSLKYGRGLSALL
jgi:transposase InsO family protein